MDEFNNDRNPFDEEKHGEQQDFVPYQQQDQYNQPQQNADPYNQQPNYNQQQNPYNQQQNPYNQPQNPYNQPQNPYNQQQNPYNQQQNLYNQQQNPYNQQQNPYQQQAPYGQQAAYGGYYQPYPQRQSTGMAVASLVLGIISILISFFSMLIFPLIIPLIGLILGIVYKTKHYSVGKGLSTAGIITSAIGLVLPFVLLAVMVAAMPSLIEYIRQTSPEEYKQLYDMYSEQFPQWFSEAAIFIKNLIIR